MELPLSNQGRKYFVEDKVGSGRYAAVYQARDEEDNIIAVKIPHVDSLTMRRKLELEKVLLQKSNHPNFVRYIDHNLKEIPYLVMEYVPDTLQDLMVKETLDQEVIQNYISQMPEVLRLLKVQRIAHCDLKPDNIGYSQGQIKVLDFGLAIPFTHSVIRWLEGENPFSPPEFKLGMILPTSDTYSAGRILEYLLVGHHSESVLETITTIELYHQIKKLPRAVRHLISGMISPKHFQRKKPEELVTLAREVHSWLEEEVHLDFSGFTTIRL